MYLRREKPMKSIKEYEFWFVTGSQHLYGPGFGTGCKGFTGYGGQS